MPNIDRLANPQHNASDETLALAVLDDPHLFIVLYDRHVLGIRRYLLSQMGSSAEIDDLTSATFTQAFARIGAYDPLRGAFAAWLFTIARNLAHDHFRSRRRLERLDQDWDPSDLTPGLDEVIIRLESDAAVLDALECLPTSQRQAIGLRYGADLSFRDIGVVMGKSEAAAKMLVQRGLDTLRRRLQEEDST